MGPSLLLTPLLFAARSRSCGAFTSPIAVALPLDNPSNVEPRSIRFTKTCPSDYETNDSDDDRAATSTRRGWLGDVASRFLAVGAIAIATAATSTAAGASVYADPDRYGDKELKVATVNKLRQTLRDEIAKDPSLAPLFVKLAMQDALTYDAATETGGPDGTVVSVILSSDAPRSVAPLRPAAEKLSEIAGRMKRTTEITIADVVSLAGAEAIESAGGPRVAVQLGKLDPRGSGSGAGPAPSGGGYPDLCGKSNGSEVVSAFARSGLTERDVALLYGAIGAIEAVVSSVVPEDAKEEEENEMGDREVYIPSSFGAPSQIYGETLGTIDNSVFVSAVADVKKGRPPIADVFADEKVGEWAAKYAGKKGGFLNDLPRAYERLMGLGMKYTGGRIGSLLGTGERDI